MSLYSYAYCIPADAPDALVADFVNFETTFTTPILFAPNRLPRGSVVSKAASGHEVIDGWRGVVIAQIGEPFGYTLFSELSTYVTAVHGGWAGEDADICLRSDDLSGTYVYLNVIAHFPQIGSDYRHTDMQGSLYVADLRLRYTLLSIYTPSDLP